MDEKRLFWFKRLMGSSRIAYTLSVIVILIGSCSSRNFVRLGATVLSGVILAIAGFVLSRVALGVRGGEKDDLVVFLDDFGLKAKYFWAHKTDPRNKRIIAGVGLTGFLVLCCGLGALIGSPEEIPPTPLPTAPIEVSGLFTQASETVIAKFTQDAPTSTRTPTFTPKAEFTFTLTTQPTAALFETATQTVLLGAGMECIPNNPPETGTVVDVVDGDTIKVSMDKDGATYSVRYIGVDTPENTTKIEPFGKEATAFNSALVAFKKVTLVRDVSETDRYGRLLRYVIVDGIFVNYELVAQGFANTASYPPDVACISTFREAERQAEAANLGLWAAAPPVAQATSTLSSGGGGACNCSGPDLDCGDFSTHNAAQACYDHCVSLGYGDIFRLDGSDNDGKACESLP